MAVKKPAHRATRRSGAVYGRGTGVLHPVDVEVGARIRQRRRFLGLEQETLANALGITFQQVHKYEVGLNRVSASRLAGIAGALGVPISYFFIGITVGGAALSAEEQARENRLRRPETIDLARTYYSIPNEKVRRQFLELVKSVAASGKR